MRKGVGQGKAGASVAWPGVVVVGWWLGGWWGGGWVAGWGVGWVG